MLIKIKNFSFMKMHLQLSCAKRRPFSPGGHEWLFDIKNPRDVEHQLISLISRGVFFSINNKIFM